MLAAHHPDHGVALSLVSVLGRHGVERMHHPRMTENEHAAPLRSAEALRAAAQRCRTRARSSPTPATGPQEPARRT
ncbi:hypothetical protein AB0J35_40570 [Nonomuraea angiospora]|uniref:hypothetical protein n=1 Tax=Nonomuraea angiospora TaxID=46172 RepID=UPI003436D081